MIRLELTKEMFCNVDIDMSAYKDIDGPKSLSEDDFRVETKKPAVTLYDALTYASLEAKGALFSIMQKIYLEFERSGNNSDKEMSTEEMRKHMCEVVGCNRDEFEAFLMLT